MRLGILRLYIGDSGTLGFYNLQELGLAKALVRNGDYDVSIFLLRDKKIYPHQEIVEIDTKIRIVYIPAIRVGTHGIMNPNFIREFNIDIVHLNSDVQLNTSRVIRWCLKNKIFVYSCTGILEGLTKNFIKKIILNAIIKINKAFLNKVQNVAKNPSVHKRLIASGITNVKLIPVGLDILEDFEYDKEKLREKYKIPSDTKLLLFVGRLEENKRPLFTLKILKEILQLNVNYSLLMVGSGSQKETISEQVNKENLGDKIYYFEKISNSDMSEIYQLSDVFLNLCDNEIFGMSILEAMYNKCPVVAKKAPGPSFIIDNEQTGYIVDNYIMQEWVLAIKKAIGNHVGIGERAKAKITSHFNWDVISEKYIILHNEILANKLDRGN